MTTPSNTSDAPERITEAFTLHATAIATKEHIAAPRLEFRIAASTVLPDGAVATLWVASAETARSHCYYLDVTADGGQSATGTGACHVPSEHIALNRAGALVVGSVGVHLATSVRVTTRRGSTTLPVTSGYFLIPAALSPGRDETHRVTLIARDGAVLGDIADLPAPGSAIVSAPTP